MPCFHYYSIPRGLSCLLTFFLPCRCRCCVVARAATTSPVVVVVVVDRCWEESCRACGRDISVATVAPLHSILLQYEGNNGTQHRQGLEFDWIV